MFFLGKGTAPIFRSNPHQFAVFRRKQCRDIAVSWHRRRSSSFSWGILEAVFGAVKCPLYWIVLACLGSFVWLVGCLFVG